MEIASLIISILSLILGIIALVLAVIFWKTTYKEFIIYKRIKNLDIKKENSIGELSNLYIELIKFNPNIEGKHFKKSDTMEDIAKTAIGNMIINSNKLDSDGEKNDL